MFVGVTVVNRTCMADQVRVQNITTRHTVDELLEVEIMLQVEREHLQFSAEASVVQYDRSF